jgi:hypothetical protein
MPAGQLTMPRTITSVVLGFPRTRVLVAKFRVDLEPADARATVGHAGFGTDGAERLTLGNAAADFLADLP